MPVDSKFYKQKKGRNFYYAFGFLILVIIFTGVLYAYNMNIETENTEIQDKISQLETSIGKLKEDEKIQVYSLYSANKKVFSQLDARSQIPEFVKNIKRTLSRYNLEMGAFDYSDGSVSLSLTSQSDKNSKAYEKVVKFLEDYRIDEKRLFDVGDISGVTGQGKIKFDVEFNIRD